MHGGAATRGFFLNGLSEGCPEEPPRQTSKDFFAGRVFARLDGRIRIAQADFELFFPAVASSPSSTMAKDVGVSISKGTAVMK